MDRPLPARPGRSASRQSQTFVASDEIAKCGRLFTQTSQDCSPPIAEVRSGLLPIMTAQLMLLDGLRYDRWSGKPRFEPLLTLVRIILPITGAGAKRGAQQASPEALQRRGAQIRVGP